MLRKKVFYKAGRINIKQNQLFRLSVKFHALLNSPLVIVILTMNGEIYSRFMVIPGFNVLVYCADELIKCNIVGLSDRPAENTF